jgi:hypothetical protein
MVEKSITFANPERPTVGCLAQPRLHRDAQKIYGITDSLFFGIGLERPACGGEVTSSKFFKYWGV